MADPAPRMAWTQAARLSNFVKTLEWPTLVLILLTYLVWGAGTLWIADTWLPAAVWLVAFAGALHGSLTHEMLHGHPSKSPVFNAALVFPALTLTVPYLRFKDLHLAHHRDSILTDPYDDPESNYQDPEIWRGLPRWYRAVLNANNTLAGRLLIGPVLGTFQFWHSEMRLLAAGDRRVWLAWVLHIPAVAGVVWWMTSVARMPVGAWLLSVYCALALLKIRTFLEHRAAPDRKARTVIVEDRGWLAFLFLNNNLHVVHHMHAAAPWYDLPRLYRQGRAAYLERNQGYRYTSYRDVFRRYFWRAKDPVPHPLFKRAGHRNTSGDR